MPRTKWIIVPAICALALAFGTPAFALNPQPLPPGLKAPPYFQASHVQVYCASGQHIPKLTSGRKPH